MTSTISLNNFFISSKGDWDEIQSIPEGFTLFYKSKSSQYFVNTTKDKIIRISNHWGIGIKKCHWFLIGYEKCHSFHWSNKFKGQNKIGMIEISQLSNM